MRRSRSTLAMFLAAYCGALWWMGFQSGQHAAALAVDPPHACILSADRSIDDVRNSCGTVPAGTAQSSPFPLLTITRGAVLAANSRSLGERLESWTTLLASEAEQIAFFTKRQTQNLPETAGMFLSDAEHAVSGDNPGLNHWTLAVAVFQFGRAIQANPTVHEIAAESRNVWNSLDELAFELSRNALSRYAIRIQSSLRSEAVTSDHAASAASALKTVLALTSPPLGEFAASTIELASNSMGGKPGVGAISRTVRKLTTGAYE